MQDHRAEELIEQAMTLMDIASRIRSSNSKILIHGPRNRIKPVEVVKRETSFRTPWNSIQNDYSETDALSSLLQQGLDQENGI